MSLSEAMLDLAKDMEDAAEGGHIDPNVVSQWSKMIRFAVKSAKGSETKQESRPHLVTQDLASQRANPMDLELAQRALNRLHTRQVAEETSELINDLIGPRFAVCVGGNDDAVRVEIRPDMPVGASVSLGGQSYMLKEDGKLHYRGDP